MCTKSSILNSTRTAIGSQCNSLSSGVARQNFVAPTTRRAAQFCTLESLDLCEWESVQQRIANVESVCHKCAHNLLCCTRGKVAPNHCNIAQLVDSRFANRHNMRLHCPGLVELYTKIPHIMRHRDQTIADVYCM